MNKEDIKALLLQEKFVVLTRSLPADQLVKVAGALVSGGVRFLEITVDQTSPDPEAALKSSAEAVRNEVGDRLIIGAGTVLTHEQFNWAKEIDASFYFSPSTDISVIREANDAGILAIPGAMTPTEIVTAWNAGADFIKLFPADDLGYHYIQNLKGPLPHIPLIMSGGVNPETIPEYFKRGASAVCTGISVVKKELLLSGDYEGIERLARIHVDAIRQYFAASQMN